tara:strand:- start:163 stop:357 length:195 start_codon:yes stop_codon:yes gene_type:complete
MNPNRKPVSRLDLLKERHQELDDEADELSSQKYLSSAEKLRLKRLKVLRLRVKDAISQFEQHGF